jgi:hypothetical protein
MTSALGTDAALDQAISYYLDLDGDLSEDYYEEWDE